MLSQRILSWRLVGGRLQWRRGMRPFFTSAPGPGNKPKTVRKEESFMRKNPKILTGNAVAAAGLVVSIGLAVGSLFLVSKDGQDQIASRSYLSMPNVEVSRSFHTSGSAGAAVTIEAFSVGEQISSEALLLRYAFDEPNLSFEGQGSGDSLTPDGRVTKGKYEPTQDDVNDDAMLRENEEDYGAAETTPGSKTNADETAKKKRRLMRKKTSRRKQMQVIGKGAYGRVVRALDRHTGQKVAMKVVPHSAMSAEALLEEVEVLKRVRGHDNIIHLIDVMYCCGKYYVVTELCEGGEILDHLISHGPFTEDAAGTLLCRITSAIEHIHRCGYVHLDIKPENLVFAGKKNVDDCRIIDFGMAHKISEVAGALSMVKGDKGSRVGTMAYWSPEQVASVVGKDGRNLSDVQRKLVESDPRACDMWALGVVLYIMLLGCHPFDPLGQGNEREMAKAILRGKYRFDIHGDQLRLGEEAKDLISGLLDPNPATRYTTRDVLEHPLLLKIAANQKRTHKDTLPTSWGNQGFEVKRDKEVEQRVEGEDEERLKPYQTDRATEAFARVLLMAVAAHGRKVCLEFGGKTSAPEMTSERLFENAFGMFDINGPEKRITLGDIESLLRSTGDEAEDEVVVSYHKHHNEPVKTNLFDYFKTALNSTDTTKVATEQGIDFDEFKAYLKKYDCVVRSFEENEIVFSQGSTPQGFYVLLNGAARLEYNDPDTKTRQFSYAKLGPGSIFGEMSLIKGRKRRSSTVRCTKPSEVLFIPKDIFLRSLAGSPALMESIFKVAMRQQATRLHQLVEYLKPKGLVTENYPPGHVLFRQGEKADYMYLIREGLIGSNTSAPSSRARGADEMSVKLSERGPGDIIGTSAATGGGGIRYSTAKCITPVNLIGIPMNELTRLKREEPVFRFYLENLIQARKEFWQARIADVERGVSEPQLLSLLLQEKRTPESQASSTKANEEKAVATPANTEFGVKLKRKKTVLLPRHEIDESKRNEQSSWYNSYVTKPLSYLNPYSWWSTGGQVNTPEPAPEPITNGGNEDDASDFEYTPGAILEKMDGFGEYADAVHNMDHLKFKTGCFIFRKGDAPEKFYIVENGTVCVEYESDNGEILRVAQLGPGDHFGEQALMEGLDEYGTSVQCINDAEILAMDKKVFFDLIGDGETTFAHAIHDAMKLRQHRWVRNILKLAKEDRKTERAKELEVRRKARQDLSRHLDLVEKDDDEPNRSAFDYFDHDESEEVRMPSKKSSRVIKQTVKEFAQKEKMANRNSVARVILQPGDVLFKRGDPVDAMYMVHRGELELKHHSHGTNPPEKLTPGDTIGVEEFGSHATRSYDAICSKPNTIVSKIPKETMDALIERHDYVSTQLRRHARRTVPMEELERRSRTSSQVERSNDQ
uniref:cGMP-dependent protein kinase n=1 Tax=Mucochytrium quahogii TaxID=96639 RepID=A0A7S2WQD9_9STRA|mmetsp:Transcript_13131/g.23531  ORF Transcript_13131/g.23531 Transcript_13131/m.23531 type:complete len:1388 (+) Transcript_13131:140-4303(+)|eukprot:CAMPEP_0203752548 /NCGR_PEP_ID=MMETSP0098-20131031/6452_1 /ASSEMBLY_ACC=CAM_ASM_000208 /TAXON_ID=96639 /ORGANISM=" , Strain NY0313808BC1" /LENGTH=1387 /DNA_ID=CAMNT_0050642761 /DNA_START=110 /DNA_END=4273 /DNA_ORIENTATION=-